MSFLGAIRVPWNIHATMVVIFLAYLSLNFYVMRKGWYYLWRHVRIPHCLYSVLFWLVALSYPFAVALRTHLPFPFYQRTAQVGHYWLAAFFYLLLILVGNDVIAILLRRLQVRLFHDTWHRGPVRAGIIVMLVIGSLIGYGRWQADRVRVTSYDISIPKQGGYLDELTMVLVSDVHLDLAIDATLTDLVHHSNSLQPDLVILAGDTIDTDVTIYQDSGIATTLQQFAADYGVYGVIGNHEYYSGNIAADLAKLAQGGIRVLRDEAVLIADSFYLVGRDDYYRKFFLQNDRMPLEVLLSGIDRSLPVVVVDHQPVDVAQAEKHGVDLQLSGHTHGGQFIPIITITRLLYPKNRGYYRRNGLQVIVSSGYGTFGPPIRLGTRSELAHIRVTFVGD